MADRALLGLALRRGFFGRRASAKDAAARTKVSESPSSCVSTARYGAAAGPRRPRAAAVAARAAASRLPEANCFASDNASFWASAGGRGRRTMSSASCTAASLVSRRSTRAQRSAAPPRRAGSETGARSTEAPTCQGPTVAEGRCVRCRVALALAGRRQVVLSSGVLWEVDRKLPKLDRRSGPAKASSGTTQGASSSPSAASS